MDKILCLTFYKFHGGFCGSPTAAFRTISSSVSGQEIARKSTTKTYNFQSLRLQRTSVPHSVRKNEKDFEKLQDFSDKIK